jgi:acyl-CoA thioesterase-1
LATLIKDNAVVLFQGDSITDAGRERYDPYSLGSGYAMIASGWFGALYPEKEVQFLNRGVSGNRTQDLLYRWQKDCIDLKPDWVSIMIGINDTWRRYDFGQAVPAESYEKIYRALLDAVKTGLGARLVLCEPFVVPVAEDRKRWREDLDPKIEVIHKLANEYEAIVVPLDKIFSEALNHQEAAYWAYDGVHPTPAGHALIAQSWLKAVEAIT